MDITQIINEAFNPSTLAIEPNGVSSKFGKTKDFKPYKQGARGVDYTTYIVYNVNEFTDSEERTEFLKFIKRGGNGADSNYQHFVKRTAIYIASFLRKNRVHTVISAGSSARFLNDVFEAVQAINPSLTYINEAGLFVKAQRDEITFDTSRKAKSAEHIAKLNKKLDNMFATHGKFTSKEYDKVWGVVTTNLFKVAPHASTTLERAVTGKNVILIDDVYSSGVTVVNMLDALGEFKPKNINALAVLRPHSAKKVAKVSKD